jgi:hypothetical protein
MKKSLLEATKLFAFCAFILAAVIWVLQVFGIRIDTLTFIKEAALLAAIALPAYAFIKRYGKVIKIIYFVILVLMIAALVVGTFNINIGL